jgi:colicin import membrane protein
LQVSFLKQHKEGLVITVLFHIGLLLLLFWFKFVTPLPLPEEKGIMVDFGLSEVGSGAVEPPKQSTPQTPPQIIDNKVTQETTQPPVPQTGTPAPSSPTASKEPVLTQNFEEAAAIEEAKKKAREEERKKEEQKKALDKQKVQQESDRLNKLASEKRIQDSLKRLDDARIAEQRRIAEARRRDSIQKADEQAKMAEINSRAKNVFGSTSGQGDANSQSSGQGVTYQPGNQGSATGTAGAGQYGPGGGEGITFNLTGRSMRTMIKPVYSENEEGVVVVTITVDINGNVVNAVAGARGTTSMNQNLWQAAIRAAKATKFDANRNAPAQQTGTITYRFVLN